MQITGLTEQQVEMLDFMWNELDTEQDFLDWYECLDTEQQKQADVLQQMIILEAFEEQLVAAKYPEANMVINQFRLTK